MFEQPADRLPAIRRTRRRVGRQKIRWGATVLARHRHTQWVLGSEATMCCRTGVHQAPARFVEISLPRASARRRIRPAARRVSTDGGRERSSSPADRFQAVSVGVLLPRQNRPRPDCVRPQRAPRAPIHLRIDGASIPPFAVPAAGPEPARRGCNKCWEALWLDPTHEPARPHVHLL